MQWIHGQTSLGLVPPVCTNPAENNASWLVPNASHAETLFAPVPIPRFLSYMPLSLPPGVFLHCIRCAYEGEPIFSNDRQWFSSERSVLSRELHVAYVRGSQILSDDRQWFPFERSTRDSLEDRPKLLGHCSNRAKWVYKAVLQAKSLPVCHFNRLSDSYNRKLPVTLAPLLKIHSTSLP